MTDNDLLEKTGFYELGRRWCHYDPDQEEGLRWVSSDTDKKARDAINYIATRIAHNKTGNGWRTTPEILYYATAGYYFQAYHNLKNKQQEKAK